MYRLTFDETELHVFIQGEYVYTLPLADYTELQQAREQALTIVEAYRTPEQIRQDALTELAIIADPEAVIQAIPEWQPGTHYRIGQHIAYAGNIYRVVQAHSAQSDWLPDAVPALYTAANKSSQDPVTGPAEWVQPTGAHDAYNTGDRVLHSGKTYESLIDSNTWSPSAYPQGWKEI